MTRRILIACCALLAVAACGGDSPTSPTPPPTGSAPFSTTDLRSGTGAIAAPGQTIRVNYQGWLYSNTNPENKGTRFDNGPLQFTLGTGSVIRGWDQGIPGMQVGGLRRIVIPPELAYGSSGNGPIPPNATLLFEVELVAIQ